MLTCSRGLWRAVLVGLSACYCACIFSIKGPGPWKDLDANGDGAVSMGESFNAAVMVLGACLVCATVVEVLTSLVSANTFNGGSKAMFAAAWFPKPEKEQDVLLLKFLETNYSRLPLPVLDPAPEAEVSSARSKRPLKTMQLDIKMSRILSGPLPFTTERRNSSPAEILQLTLKGKDLDIDNKIKNESDDGGSDDDESGVEDPRLERFTDLVNNFHMWNFDMFSVSEATTQPLVFVGYSCLDRCGGVDLDKLKLVNFLRAVEDKYRSVPYHNSLHGAAVGRLIFSLCKTAGLGRRLPCSMQFALVLAGLVHDVGHPGLTASFLNKALDEVTLKYNDQSPLENMHLAITFELLARTANQFLDADMVTSIRGVLIRTVLSTDMAKHAELIARLDMLIENLKLKEQARCPWYWPSSPPGYYSQEEREVWEGKLQQEFIMEAFLHAADIGTPALPFEQFLKWNELVRKEFHAQGDRERAEFGALISPPGGFDRSASPLALHKFDRFFLRYLSLPTFEKLNDLAMITVNHKTCVASGVDISHCLTNLHRNVELWDEITPEES
mmetsp:Transcript_69345/g.166246  ORF Transcript_69345/g.166246 Transcript_69345/m.166246 type:complete len:557 (+) Transcript_69345:142-1812(+)